MAQLVASMCGVVLGGVVKVVGSNLARGKIFTASIGSYIYIHIIYTEGHNELTEPIDAVNILLLARYIYIR